MVKSPLLVASIGVITLTASTQALAAGPVNYMFEARMNGYSVPDIGRGAATGMAPVKRWKATVQSVQRGSGIRPGQAIFIEITPAQSSLNLTGYCRFTAANKHPAFAAGTLILDATANGCRTTPMPPAPRPPVTAPQPKGYSYEGLITASNYVDLGYGNTNNPVYARRLVTVVQRVNYGSGIRNGQNVQVELIPAQYNIQFNGYCRITAPHLHPAYGRGTLLLNGQVSNCRNKL